MRKNTTAVVFRRTSTQLRQNGGIWQEATTVFKQMFGKDVIIRSRDLEIYIPSTNSTIKFSHLQHLSDINNHLGAQYSLVIFDEATLFPFEEMILPLMGRMRNANVDYKPQMMWATNPAYNHGIYHWIKDFYLDENGIPFEDKSNIERFFILQNNKPLWYDTREEAEAIHGTGLETPVQSFRSIRAHISQNIPLLRANPGYITNLKSLPDIKRRIFLDGSWTAREEEAGYFSRLFCKVVPYPNVLATRRVRAWDLAATKPSTASPDPDWTRGTLVSKDKNSLYTVEDIQSIRERPHEVEKLIYATALDDPPGTVQCIACDPGSAGIAYSNTIKVRLAELGVSCRIVKSNKSKLLRFLPFSALAEAGVVQFVKSEWLEEAFEELENFNGAKNHGKDDICDTLSDAIYVLNQGGAELPQFTLPDLQQSTSYSNLGFSQPDLPIGDAPRIIQGEFQ